MNRDFDIDNILAEIKIKRDNERRPRTQAWEELSEEAAPSRSNSPAPRQEPQRAQPPRQESARVSREEAQPWQEQPRAYEEYEPIRPAKRRTVYEEERQYEPASAIFALAEEYGAEKKRVQKPQRESTRAQYEQQEPRERSARPRHAQEERHERKEAGGRFQMAERRGAEQTAYELEYEAEFVGREAFEEPVQPKRGGRFGKKRNEEEDEFLQKFSQVTPLGARKQARIDRDHVRSHFGEAEPIAPKELKPRAYQRAAAEPEEPSEQVRRFSKPELKGGFRMEPDYDEEPAVPDGATRVDLPLAPAGVPLYADDMDRTRDMPIPYDYDEDLPPEEEYDEEPPYENEPAGALPLDEFETPEEAAAVRQDIGALRRGLMVRFFITAIMLLGLLYLGLAQSGLLPGIGFVSPDTAPRAFAIASVSLLAVAAVACHSTISGGIVSLFTLKANNDALPALATLACIMQGVAVILQPQALTQVQLYACVAAAGLFFSSVGRLFTLGRISGNFRFLSSNEEKFSVQSLTERELGRELTWDMNIEEAHVSYSTRADFLCDFIRQSYAPDTTDSVAKITAPIIFLASVAVAVFSYVMGSDVFMALSVFAAVLSIASPFTGAIVGSLPLHKAYRALSRRGAMLSGYNAVERFADTNVVLADACDLFTSDEVLLHNIKTFAKTRIDDAILDAASVLCMCNGAVKNIFLRIIQGNTKMLKYVENIVYEDAMGISAWVSGKRVLIGNSDLMKHHGIDTPSRDYEAKYRTEDRDILYLANSGELTAMFVISYVANRAVDEALCDLERKGISVVVRSVDPNLTAAKIARIYDLPEEMIRMLPGKLHTEYDALCGGEHERDDAYIAHNGGFCGFARAVGAAGSVRVATNIGLIVQIVGMVLGYALITFFSFMGAMDQTGVATVLVFQAVWSAAVWLFSSLKRI